VTENEITRRNDREGPDMVTLVAGLLSVAIAGGVLLGFGGQMQWLLAVAAVGIGIVMLIASFRPRRNG
jgi:divalent metal cation (Fe/Co/Zn/Cd) transporter